MIDNRGSQGSPAIDLVFLLEEPSMRVVLAELLPRLLPEDISHTLVTHQGKSDLEASLPRKLRAWRTPGTYFIVLRDQDAASCKKLKEHLAQLCREAGRPDALVRIVCHELESWLLGDLRAVAAAFDEPRLIDSMEVRKFREPDRLANAAQELKLLVPGYQKVGGARAIAPHLEPARNRSHSFQVFLQGLTRLIEQARAAGAKEDPGT